MSRLYVRPVTPDIGEDAIRQHFESAGTVTKVAIVNRYCFVEYAEPDAAQTAVDTLHNKEFQGHKLQVEKSHSKQQYRETHHAPQERPPPRVPTHRLRVDGLARGATWRDLKDACRDAGVDAVLTVVYERTPGAGFVDVASEADKDTALSKLQGTVVLGSPIHLEVDPAGPSLRTAPRRPRDRERGGRDRGGRDSRGPRRGRDDRRGGRGSDRRDGDFERQRSRSPQSRGPPRNSSRNDHHEGRHDAPRDAPQSPATSPARASARSPDHTTADSKYDQEW